MSESSIQKKIVAALVLAMFVFALAGCSSPAQKPSKTDTGTTDQMWSDKQKSTEIDALVIDGKAYTIEGGYSLELAGEPIGKDGFYKIIADVTYLNGGIAGYVNYPQIDRVLNIEEVSSESLDLPSIKETSFGLVRIGDYADADVFFWESGKIAVWKNGKWEYTYSDDFKREDGSRVVCRTGLSRESVETGIANGVILCEDYFLLPPSK